MTINDEAWDVVTKELMIIGRVIEEKEGKDTGEAFFDAAVEVHTLFHVSRQFLDTGAYLPPDSVLCACAEKCPPDDLALPCLVAEICGAHHHLANQLLEVRQGRGRYVGKYLKNHH